MRTNYRTYYAACGPEVLFETCVAMKFVNDDDDDDDDNVGFT